MLRRIIRPSGSKCTPHLNCNRRRRCTSIMIWVGLAVCGGVICSKAYEPENSRHDPRVLDRTTGRATSCYENGADAALRNRRLLTHYKKGRPFQSSLEASAQDRRKGTTNGQQKVYW